jgi:Flp pilus assembly protein protease CpaA
MNGFFPNPAFGWVFSLSLLSVLLVALYFDFRFLIIPNKLTVPALAAGFVFNAVRQGLISARTDEAFRGIIDGLVFALLGFLLGFGLFFCFWLIRLCRGGDVKLFAAVASWLGWNCSFWVWLLSFMILSAMLAVFVLARAFAGGKETKLPPVATSSGNTRKGIPFPYSLPLTVAAVVVFLWLQSRA